MAAVNSSEFILQTKLRLYLQRILLSSINYIIDIKTKNYKGELSEASVVKEIVPMEDGYIEFEVAPLVRLLGSKGE